MRRIAALVGASALALVGGACGDEDSAGAAEFCEGRSSLAFEPSDEQLDELVAIAPGAVRDDVVVVTEAVKEAGRPVDIEVTQEYTAASDRLNRWIAENCETEEAPAETSG